MAKLRGGDKLEEALRRISKNLSKGGTLKVGFLEGAKYPDGTPIAQVAYFNEYGRTVRASRVSVGLEGDKVIWDKGGDYFQLPRPFFRIMISQKSPGWAKGISAQLKATNYDVEKTFKITGGVLVGQLQQSIDELVTPPLAPSTVAAKGHDKPLIASGDMRKAAAYEVVMK